MFGPHSTPECTDDILKERKRLEHASQEIARLHSELVAVSKEAESLREMNQTLSAAFRTSGHSALNKELEQLRAALNAERLRAVEARAEVLRYEEAERQRSLQSEDALIDAQNRVSEGQLVELDQARKTISGLRARIDDLEECLLKERQSVTRATAIVTARHENRVIEMQRSKIEDLEKQLADRDHKVHDLARLVQTLQLAVGEAAVRPNPSLTFLRSV